MDDEFIHLSTKDQLERIIGKFFEGALEIILLKIATAELPGELILEANPGGKTQFYHLYRGFIPLASIIEVTIVKQSR